MIKKISIIAVLLIFLLGQVAAQEFAPVGTAVAQFLEIGMGARATAMGEAFTAVTNDASSVFWNPAGVAAVEQRNLFLAYNSWPADIAVGGMSFAYGFENAGVVAISAIYLMTDDVIDVILSPQHPEFDAMMKLYSGVNCEGGGDSDLIECYHDGYDGAVELFSYRATADGWYSIVVDGRSAFDEYHDYGEYAFQVGLTCATADCCCP